MFELTGDTVMGEVSKTSTILGLFLVTFPDIYSAKL